MLKPLTALASVALATALVFPTVSQAEEYPSVRVTYADLNLASDFGRNKLQHRIAFAATEVCGTSDPRDLDFVRAVGDCRSDTIAYAQPAFRAAVGEALHPSVRVLDTSALIITARR